VGRCVVCSVKTDGGGGGGVWDNGFASVRKTEAQTICVAVV